MMLVCAMYDRINALYVRWTTFPAGGRVEVAEADKVDAAPQPAGVHDSRSRDSSTRQYHMHVCETRKDAFSPTRRIPWRWRR